MHILIIDDEPNICRSLKICLEGDGHSAVTVSSATQAREEVARQVFDVAFLDVRLGRENGLDLLPDLLAEAPWLNIIVITAFASIESAVEAMQRGAKDYLPKPFTPAQVRLATEKTARWRKLEQQNEELRSRLDVLEEIPFLQTGNPKMKTQLETARKAAASDACILLDGETGTGKTILARLIHTWSPRHHGPFGVISCPTLALELLESELFGHVRGAFTGAVKDVPGRIALCDGGTLFLDEIGDLPLPLQPKLLRFLQDHTFERLGDNRPRRADVRIIAATNVNLHEAINQGTFRRDLFHRLAVITLTLPPLRERPEDIPLLARHFLQRLSEIHHRPDLTLADEASAGLTRHAWPGNLRELRNMLERAAILSPTPCVHLWEQFAEVSQESNSARSEEHPAWESLAQSTLAEVEKAHLKRVLSQTSSLQQAARILGIDPATLFRKRRKLSR